MRASRRESDLLTPEVHRRAVVAISPPAKAHSVLRRLAFVLSALVLVLVFGVGRAPAAKPPQTVRWGQSVPAAQVGAYYFDGWSGPLTNFHFDGLVRPGANGQFPERQPLSGWRDNTVESMRTQLSWARQDGISFFAFDWYGNDIDPLLNVAHDNYLKMRDHQGVGFAVAYVNNDPFGISPDNWPAAVEKWVTEDFLNPDYVRVDGKPLFIVLDTVAFRQQWGDANGVNSALAALQGAAKRHGLPGVFIIGDRASDWISVQCFPICESWQDGGPGGLVAERYDALSDFAYSWIVEPLDGPRPYADLVEAETRAWNTFADRSARPYVPAITDGWAPQPWNERYDGRLLVSFTRTPAEVGGFLQQAINWLQTHPTMKVGAMSARPLVLLESWNELGEGSYVLPTRADGYTYGQALANALGIPWRTFHPRHFVLAKLAKRLVAGALIVDDGWTPCDVDELVIQRRAARAWIAVSRTNTRPGGSFSIRLPKRPGEYRLRAAPTIRYQQRCGGSMSVTLPR